MGYVLFPWGSIGPATYGEDTPAAECTLPALCSLLTYSSNERQPSWPIGATPFNKRKLPLAREVTINTLGKSRKLFARRGIERSGKRGMAGQDPRLRRRLKIRLAPPAQRCSRARERLRTLGSGNSGAVGPP